MLPLIIPEIDDLPEEPLMQLAEIFQETVLKVALDETPQQLALSAEISSIPPLGQVVGPIWKIQKTLEIEQAEARADEAKKQVERRKAHVPVNLQRISSDDAPDIDGQIDPIWQQAESHAIKNPFFEKTDGPEDPLRQFQNAL